MLVPLPEVLRDWRPNSVGKWQKLSDVDNNFYKEGTVALLRAQLKGEVAKDDGLTLSLSCSVLLA